jgi:hypothetical protein
LLFVPLGLFEGAKTGDTKLIRRSAFLYGRRSSPFVSNKPGVLRPSVFILYRTLEQFIGPYFVGLGVGE